MLEHINDIQCITWKLKDNITYQCYLWKDLFVPCSLTVQQTCQHPEKIKSGGQLKKIYILCFMSDSAPNQIIPRTNIK